MNGRFWLILGAALQQACATTTGGHAMHSREGRCTLAYGHERVQSAHGEASPETIRTHDPARAVSPGREAGA